MAGTAVAIAEAPSDGPDAPADVHRRMAAAASGLRVPPDERVAREPTVIEATDLEAAGLVAHLAFTPRLAQSELTDMAVVVAARTLARRSAIARTVSGESILLGGRVARGAREQVVGAGQRPRGMIDVRPIPPVDRVALRASSLRHLGGELIAVGVVVALVAARGIEVPAEARSLARVAAAAGHREVATLERQRSGRVLRAPERRRCKSLYAMAVPTLAARSLRELSTVRVRVTARARIEFELAIATLPRNAGHVAGGALHLLVRADEGERGVLMGPQTDRSGEPLPADRSVAAFARATEIGLVHGVVTAHAVGTGGGRGVEAAVVTALAPDLVVTVREAETGVVLANCTRLGPRRLGVALLAAVAVGCRVRVAVTARAVSVFDPAVAWRRSVTAGAIHPLMGAAKREAGARMIESVHVHAAPGALRVAALTTCPEPRVVRVFVARPARPARTEIRPRPAPAVAAVAIVAAGPVMSASQRVSDVSVIERVAIAARPADQTGARAAMIHVTAATVLAAVPPAVQAGARSRAGNDVPVTIARAAGVVGGLASGFVTGPAVRVALELIVGSREGPGRQELSAGYGGREHHGERAEQDGGEVERAVFGSHADQTHR